MLDRDQIERIIPHRAPFLFLDKIIDLEPGERAVAEIAISGEEEYLRGHFPEYPVMPGVLQVEALAQTGAVAALSAPHLAGKLVLFAGIDKVRFRRQIRPGDTLRLEVELIRMRESLGKGEGRAYVGDELALSGILTFALADPS